MCRERDRKKHSCIPLNKNALFSVGTSSLSGFVLREHGNLSGFQFAVWLFFLSRDWSLSRVLLGSAFFCVWVDGFIYLLNCYNFFCLPHDDEKFPPSNGILMVLLEYLMSL